MISSLLSGLISGLIVCIVSTCLFIRHERRQQKLEVLRSLVGNRHGITPKGGKEANDRFFQALNEAFAVFHDSKGVIKAIQDFKIHPNKAADNTTHLIRRMCEDLKIDVSFLDDEFFSTPLVPGEPQS